METLTEEKIESGLAREDVETQKASGDDADFDFEKRSRHRAFKTKNPGEKDEDLHSVEELDKRQPSRVKRTLIFILAFIIFLGVVGVGLAYFLSRGKNTEMQVGSTDPRLRDQSSQAESKRQAEEALKAVTESASAPPAQTATRAPGDLSQPVVPDPLASTTYPPTSVSPYSTGTQPSQGETQTSTPSTSTVTSGNDTGTRTETASVTSAGSGGSFYLFRRPDVGRASEPAASQDAQSGSVAPIPATFTQPSTRPSQPAAPVKPPFGAMIPVRLLDSVMTLREGGVVRMETTRAISGAGGWKIPRGTIVVARLGGGNNNRAYLNVVGFIDAETNRLVSVGGEVKGSDGAGGIRGERKRVNSRWMQGLKEISRAGISLGSAFLIGRRGGGGYYPPPSASNIPTPGGSSSSSQNANLDFIYVPAGAQAFVMITELPPTVEGRDADTLNAADDLTDEELAGLLTEGTPEQIRAALPRMNPELRRVAEMILAQDEKQEGKK